MTIQHIYNLVCSALFWGKPSYRKEFYVTATPVVKILKQDANGIVVLEEDANNLGFPTIEISQDFPFKEGVTVVLHIHQPSLNLTGTGVSFVWTAGGAVNTATSVILDGYQTVSLTVHDATPNNLIFKIVGKVL